MWPGGLLKPSVTVPKRQTVHSHGGKSVMPRGVYPRKSKRAGAFKRKRVSWKGKKPNPKAPPRVKLVINLPAQLAVRLIEAADEDGKTVSRLLTELLSGE
jgi:hypothetical protein